MTMGLAYSRAVEDRSLLMMQMQAYVASEDEDVRAVVREEFIRLVRFVQSASGASDDEIRPWIAFGMLMNIGAALDLSNVDADWARMCLGDGDGTRSRRSSRRSTCEGARMTTRRRPAGIEAASWRSHPFYLSEKVSKC